MAEVLTPDLCVIGGGASGLAVARAARRLGADVVVVERGHPGGMSPRTGALALSALLAAAEKAAAARAAPGFGIQMESPKPSFRKIHDQIAGIIRQAGPDTAPPLLAAEGIQLIEGSGSFADPRTVQAGETTIRARRFVIATGAVPAIPELPGLFSVPFFTPETIFDNTRKLTHLVIIGAGPAGLELALAHRRLGCDVTLVEAGPILPQMDPELAAIALRRLRDEGVVILDNASVVAIQARSQGIGVVLRNEEQPAALDASHILVAGGRVPALADLNLDAARIRRAKGDAAALSLSPALRTSNSRVWAVGEAAGHGPAPHFAPLEAEIVVNAALLGRPACYDAAAVPRLVLTDPTLAEIGLNEPMARARFRNGGFDILRAGYAETDAGRASRETMGVVKLITDKGGMILGAGIVGPGAAELSALFSLAIAERIPLARLAGFAAPYPSHAELVRQLGAAAAAGQARSKLDEQLFKLNRLLHR